MPPKYPPPRGGESDVSYQMRRNEFCSKHITPHCQFNIDGNLKESSIVPIIFLYSVFGIGIVVFLVTALL